MVTALLLILYFWGPQPFCPVGSWSPPFCCWALCRCWLIRRSRCSPATAAAAREGQRELAFVFTGVGYTIAFLWALLAGVSPEIRTICAGYFFSALFLTLCNRVLHRRASGHACSAAGPLLFLIYYFGWWLLLPSIVIGWLVAWASVALKRHTPTDLLWGALCSAAGFAIAVLWF